MNRRMILMTTMAGLALGSASLVVGTGMRAAVQAPADVAGDWALTVETANGTTTPSVTLAQDGAELTGHYSSATLGEAEVTGTVTGNDVRFWLQAAVQGFDVDVVYAGTVQDDGTLVGEISLGALGDGTFTGKRR